MIETPFCMKHKNDDTVIVLNKEIPDQLALIKTMYANGIDWVVCGEGVLNDYKLLGFLNEDYDSQTYNKGTARNILYDPDYPYVAFPIDTKEILQDILKGLQ